MDKKKLNEVIKDLPKLLDLSVGQLNSAMVQQPSLYFYFAQLYHKANYDAGVCKNKMEIYEAEICKKLKGSAISSGIKVTDKFVNSVIVSDVIWQGISGEVRESEYCAGVLNAACRALEHRRDMLINLGATVRAELGSEVRINKEL